MSDADWVMSEQDFDVLRRLREAGIKSAKLPIGEFEFFPPGVAVTKDTTPDGPHAMALGEPEQCRCGHDETSHGTEGLCLLGCDAGKCVEVKANA